MCGVRGWPAGIPRRSVGRVEARLYQHRLQFIDAFRVGVVGVPGEGLPRRHLRPLGRAVHSSRNSVFISLNSRLARVEHVVFYWLFGCERLKIDKS